MPDTQEIANQLFRRTIDSLLSLECFICFRIKHSKQKKVKPISTNHSSAIINFTTDQTAKLEIKTSRYVFKNKTVEVIFGVFGHQNEFKHRKYIFTVPKNWKVLSVKQAKALQKKLAKQALLRKQMMLKKQAAANSTK